MPTDPFTDAWNSPLPTVKASPAQAAETRPRYDIAQPTEEEQPGAIRRFAQGLGIPTSMDEIKGINDRYSKGPTGAITAIAGPVPVVAYDTLHGLASESGTQAGEALDALQHKEYGNFVKHSLGASIPMIGPPMADGNYAGAAGRLTGLGLAAMGEHGVFPKTRRAMAERFAASGTGTDIVGEYGSHPAEAVLDHSGVALTNKGRLAQLTKAKKSLLTEVRNTVATPEIAQRVSDITNRINSAAEQVKSYTTSARAAKEVELLRNKAIQKAMGISPTGTTILNPEGVLDLRQWADGGISGNFGANSASVSNQFYKYLRGELKDHLNNVAPEVADLNSQAHSLIDAEEQTTSHLNSESKKPVIDTHSIPSAIKSVLPAKTLVNSTASKLLSLGTKETRTIPKPNVPIMRAPNAGSYDGGLGIQPPRVAMSGSYEAPPQGVPPRADFAGTDAGELFDVRNTTPGHVPNSLPFNGLSDSEPPLNIPQGNSGNVMGLLPRGNPSRGGFRQGDQFTSYPSGPVTTPGVKFDPRLASSMREFKVGRLEDWLSKVGYREGSGMAEAAKTESLLHMDPDYNSQPSQNIPVIAPPANILPAQSPSPAPGQNVGLSRRPTVRSKVPTIPAKEVSHHVTHPPEASPLGMPTQAGGYGLGSSAVTPPPFEPGRFNNVGKASQLGENVTISVNGKPTVAKVSSVTKVNGLTKVRVTYPDVVGTAFETFEFKH